MIRRASIGLAKARLMKLAITATVALAATAPLQAKAPAHSRVMPDDQLNSPWFVAGEAAVAGKNFFKGKSVARNIILFVGDGMGITTVTAARILDGQQKGMSGEENRLSFERFPFTGFSTTYSVDEQVADSAATMDAMVTGVKTDSGVLGVDEDVVYGDCSTLAGNELVTALELAEISGRSTGIVTTATVTHATPGANYAKTPDREWEDISSMPPEAVAAGCKDIALQLIEFEPNLERRFPGVDVDGIEVVMGGGRGNFLPAPPPSAAADPAAPGAGNRTDGRDLVQEWQVAYPDGRYIVDQAGLGAIDPDSNPRVFGLFTPSHMRYEAQRTQTPAGEPSLMEMTVKAIDVLSKNRKGFFLVVEGARIDHAHHAGNAYNALMETIELSKAVQAAVEKVDLSNTLIIATADHSHVFTMTGHPRRGNPILGKLVPVDSDTPALAVDNLPYTTLSYANGLGFRNLGAETNADKAYADPPVAGRNDLTNVDTESPGFHQEALIPLEYESHGGEDVPIYAIGPGAYAVVGANEQNVIFHVMNRAGRLQQEAAKKAGR